MADKSRVAAVALVRGAMHVREFGYGRQRLQPVFRFLHRSALKGLNYGVDEPERNGEYRLLDRLAADWEMPVVFDAGGFKGEWSAAVLARAPQARIYTFEPNISSAEHIQRRLGDSVSLHRLALGAKSGTAPLSAPPGIPQMGSLHVRDLRHVGLSVNDPETVAVTTVDGFCAEHGIDRIDLLKLDVEGHEYAALQGAAGMLASGAIGAVQFEFGGAALDSRVFFRDLLDVLDGYQVFRILRDGLDLVDYHERDEIFMLSNFVALK